jgi:hypothetical protein
LLSLTACSSASDALVDVKSGLERPESALYDPVADVYLVSNVGGAPLARDGNGFISKISPEGKLLEARFIESGKAGVELHAPKGMAIVGDLLAVVDLDGVALFERVSGKPVKLLAIDDPGFLNDVLVWDESTLFVTDTAKNRISRVSLDGTVSTLIESPRLGGPNGIARCGDGLCVVGFDDGSITNVSIAGEIEKHAKASASELDGIVITPDGRQLVASWAAKAVLIAGDDGKLDTLFKGLESPADIGFDTKRGRVLVPMMLAGRFIVLALPK